MKRLVCPPSSNPGKKSTLAIGPTIVKARARQVGLKFFNILALAGLGIPESEPTGKCRDNPPALARSKRADPLRCFDDLDLTG
jgi:hypothetical protein